MENNPNDVMAVTDAKRFIDILDIFSECVEWISSIPNNLNCWIFGNCETDDGDGNVDVVDEDGGNEDEEEDLGIDPDEEPQEVPDE